MTKASLASEFGSGASIGTIDVTRSPNAEFAGHGANFTAFLPVTVQEQTLNVQLTIIDYLKGTENETVTLTSIESPFPTTLATHLTTLAVDRFCPAADAANEDALKMDVALSGGRLPCR